MLSYRQLQDVLNVVKYINLILNVKFRSKTGLCSQKGKNAITLNLSRLNLEITYKHTMYVPVVIFCIRK